MTIVKTVTINDIEFKAIHQAGYSGGQWMRVYSYYVAGRPVSSYEEYSRLMLEAAERLYPDILLPLEHGKRLK